MRYGEDNYSRQEYIRRRRQAQKMIRLMLLVFFLLTLAFATVSIVLAFRLHSLSRIVDELEAQLTEYQRREEESGPVGAGGSTSPDGNREEDELSGAQSVTEPDTEPTAEPDGTAPDGAADTTEEQTAGTTQEQSSSGTEGESGQDNESREDWSDKKVYLTFDDGPSDLTDDILDVLKQYDAKATFFVIGRTDSQSKQMYQRIVEEGHTLGIHSYTHQYNEIYASVEAFAADFMKLSDLLYEVTGKRPAISRFPGGSSNKKAKGGIEPFIRYLNEQGIVYFDWNVENGDATGVKYTTEELTQNALDGIKTFKNSVVLMHDTNTKGTTLESLPDLLDTLTENGAQLLALDETVTPVQHVKAGSVN